MSWRTTARSFTVIVILTVAETENSYQILYCTDTSKRFQWLWLELENNHQILCCTHTSEGFDVWNRNWRTTTRPFIVPIILMFQWPMAQSGEWLPDDPVLYPYFWRFYWLWQEMDNNYDILYYSYNSEGFSDWYKLKNKFQNLYCTHDSDDFSDRGMSWRTTTRSCSRLAWVRGLWFLTV